MKHNRKKNSYYKGVLFLMVIALAVGGLLYYQKQKSIITIPDEAVYSVATGDIQKDIISEGPIEAIRTVSIHALANAKIIDDDFEIGDSVEEGAVLYELDRSELDYQIQRQKIAVESATYSRKSVTGNEWEVRRLAVEDAQLVLDNLNKQLENYTVTAPFTGIITEKKYSSGDVCAKNEIVASIADLSNFKIRVKIYEEDINHISLDQEAEISVTAIGKTVHGRVTDINCIGKSENGITSYDVTLEINKQEMLPEMKPGMNAKVTILKEKKTGIIVVPTSLVNSDLRVYVLKDIVSGEGEYRRIEIGLSDEDYVEVTKGLSVGDAILINPEKFFGAK